MVVGLAKRLGVHKATVFFWIRRGLILPGRRIGRYRFWTDSEARAIVDRVAMVRGRLDRYPPVQVAHGDAVVWACPFCMFRASRSAPVKTHMRSCTKVWDVDAYQTRKDAGLPRDGIFSRKALADFALRVIDGAADMDALAAKVKARLERIEALEAQLRALRSEENG